VTHPGQKLNTLRTKSPCLSMTEKVHTSIMMHKPVDIPRVSDCTHLSQLWSHFLPEGSTGSASITSDRSGLGIWAIKLEDNANPPNTFRTGLSIVLQYLCGKSMVQAFSKSPTPRCYAAFGSLWCKCWRFQPVGKCQNHSTDIMPLPFCWG